MRTTIFALTGGPGSGKTTLIELLAAHGYETGCESGRAVIRREMASGGDALPWSDPLRFAEAMLAVDVATHSSLSAAGGIAFADRGVPDIIGYLALCDLAPPAALLEAARSLRYAPVVFAAPPWAEIYHRDTERRQDFAEAERTFNAVTAAWRRFGYRVENLPRAAPAVRLEYLLECVATIPPG